MDILALRMDGPFFLHASILWLYHTHNLIQIHRETDLSSQHILHSSSKNFTNNEPFPILNIVILGFKFVVIVLPPCHHIHNQQSTRNSLVFPCQSLICIWSFFLSASISTKKQPLFLFQTLRT